MPVVVGQLEPKELEAEVNSQYMGSYVWTIRNYSSYSSKRLIHSPTFEKGGETWRLWLFPKGSTHATEGDMSLFLHYIKEEDVFSAAPVEHPRAKFSIKILDQLQGDGIQHQINDFHNFGESNGEWGWKDFAQISRLTEEDSGLLINDTMKVELNLHVRAKREDAPESELHSGICKLVGIRLLTDKNLRMKFAQNNISSGLMSFEDCKNYCFCSQMHLANVKELISQDLQLNKEHLRLWLCEQQPANQLKIVKNLSNKSLKVKRILDVVDLKKGCLARVGTSAESQMLDIFAESPPPGKDELPPLLNEEDWITFLKVYDPFKVEMKYVGTIPLRKDCTPAEVMVDARMLAGMKAGTDVAMYIERPFSASLVHEIRPNDFLDSVGLRPGSTLVVQQKVDPAYAKGKEMKYPKASRFLEDVILHEIQGIEQISISEEDTCEPHDDVCVVCFTRPKTVGFLHGNTLHRCVCRECAAHVMKENGAICPLCRQEIERVIDNIF